LLFSCPGFINLQPAGMNAGRSPVFKYPEKLWHIRKKPKKRLKIGAKKFINNLGILTYQPGQSAAGIPPASAKCNQLM
jgi:hypothetical protein